MVSQVKRSPPPAFGVVTPEETLALARCTPRWLKRPWPVAGPAIPPGSTAESYSECGMQVATEEVEHSDPRATTPMMREGEG